MVVPFPAKRAWLVLDETVMFVSPFVGLRQDSTRSPRDWAIMGENQKADGGVMKRTAWTVLVPGYAPFTMAGEACTEAEALAAVRTIWPDAEVRT